MRFLKIGNRYINADQIRDVYKWNERTFISFDGNEDHDLSFQGDEATALIAWLEQRCDVVYPPPKADDNE